MLIMNALSLGGLDNNMAMKTKEFRERAGHDAIHIAEQGGYSKEYWRIALMRDSEIGDKYKPLMVAAIDARVKALSALKRDLKREIS